MSLPIDRHLVFIGEERPRDAQASDLIHIYAFEPLTNLYFNLAVTIDSRTDSPASTVFTGTADSTYGDFCSRCEICLHPQDPFVDMIVIKS